jgi:hypothetical protein
MFPGERRARGYDRIVIVLEFQPMTTVPLLNALPNSLAEGT